MDNSDMLYVGIFAVAMCFGLLAIALYSNDFSGSTTTIIPVSSSNSDWQNNTDAWGINTNDWVFTNSTVSPSSNATDWNINTNDWAFDNNSLTNP